jgi:hypothetical protein
MTAIEMRVDLSALVDALVSRNENQIVALAREHLRDGEAADVLIGRIGLLAARGDADGHTVITLTAAAMLSRLLHTIPLPLEGNEPVYERALPLFVQALLAAAPAVQAGFTKQVNPPDPLYPSGLQDGQTVNSVMHDAVYHNDPILAERLLLGLYGTGADYRTMQVRAYDGISTTFQDAGHPLMFAVRGFQLLDTVEWGDRAPAIIHWLAPHLSLRPTSNEPNWISALRNYTTDSAHDVSGVRKRLAVPKDENALPLRRLVLSDADTTQVCQGVYDALLTNGASPRAIGSVLALAAAEVMQMVDDGNRELFVQVAHGLLFSSAIRLAFRQVQDVEILALLFTSAAYINALYKEVAGQQHTPSTHAATASSRVLGGGLIAPSLLEALRNQLLKEQDIPAALTTAQRYLKLGYDVRALFATIGLVAAQNDALADQGHTLQIVQAASEEFMAWPTALTDTNIEALLLAALRAAAFGKRNELVAQL